MHRRPGESRAVGHRWSLGIEAAVAYRSSPEDGMAVQSDPDEKACGPASIRSRLPVGALWQ